MALVPFVPSILSNMYEENISLSIGGHINQAYNINQGGRGTGSIIWSASYLLSSHLSQSTIESIDPNGQSISLPCWKGKRVLELGAGLGVLSITLALLGAYVVATDGEPSVVQRLSTNIMSNLPAESLYKAMVYRWGDPIDDVIQANDGLPFDFIIAADVVYGHDMHAWEALLSSILSLASSPSTVVYIAQTHRYDNERLFFRKLEKNFLRLHRISLSADNLDRSKTDIVSISTEENTCSACSTSGDDSSKCSLYIYTYKDDTTI
eukprot:gene6315-12775_t